MYDTEDMDTILGWVGVWDYQSTFTMIAAMYIFSYECQCETLSWF